MSRRRNRITQAIRSGPTGLAPQRHELAVRIVGLTQDLVGCAARREWAPLVQLLLERRALIERLAQPAPWSAERPCLQALQAAVAESDRTVGQLLDAVAGVPR